MKETCGNCKFYIEDDLLCVRYPPLRVSHEYGTSVNFPNVGSNKWCGEWKSKESDGEDST